MLRPSLLPGLVDACAHNRRRERKDVRLFETGSRFTSEGEGRAVPPCGLARRRGPHWSAPARTVDFFDVKGVVEEIAAALGVAVEFAPVASAISSSPAGPLKYVRVRPTARQRSDSGSSANSARPSPKRAASPPAKSSTSPKSTSTRWRSLPVTTDRADRIAAALSLDRARHLDARRRSLACRHRSWHYPFGGPVDAGVDRRVRSLSGQGRAGGPRQPVAAPHVPRSGAHADGRRSRRQRPERLSRRCAPRTAPNER